MSSTAISQDDQQVINYFTQNNFFVWNVRDKIPVAGSGDNGWSKISYDDIKKYWDLSSNAWGMRTGKQPNGKFIIGLDFDTWHKVGTTYINCNNTIGLLSEFTRILGEQQDGFYISGTENNRGCLVNIAACPYIIELLDIIGKGRFQAENYHLEILNGHNFVIPPTATNCKISKVLRARKFMNNTYIHELQEDSPVYKFILDYIRKCMPKQEISKELYRKKADKEVLSNIEEELERNRQVVKGFNKLLIEFLNCVSPARAATYDNWFKLGLACQKNCETEEDKKEAYFVFRTWSSNLNGYDPIEFDKHWKSWWNYNYDGLNFNYIMKCAKRDNPDKWFKCWLKYGIEMKKSQTLSKIDAFEKEVRCVLEPKLFLTKEFSFSGIEKWYTTTNYANIVHKYHLKFDEEFMYEYLKSKDKKIWYDRMDFRPTFKEVAYENKDLKVLNTFRGWDILNKKIVVPQAKQTIINCDHENFKISIETKGAGSIFMEHILGMLGDDKTSWFMLQWISNFLIDPDNRALCVPLLKGEHGCGKTSIIELLQAIIDGDTFTGDDTYYWCCDNPDQMLGNFNASLYERILVNLNEPTFETLERYKEKNKRIITDKTLNIERKGQDVITVTNPIWEIITTNNDKIFTISSTERRFFIIDCKDNLPQQEKQAKFEKFYAALADKEALMDFYLICKQIRKEGFNQLQYEAFIKNNKTLYHQQMVQSSISPFWGLIQEYIDEAEEQGETTIFKRQTDIFKALNAYCRARGLSNPDDTNAVKTYLLSFDPTCYKRTRIPSDDGKEKRLDQFVINVEKIKDYMVRKQLVDTTISD